ncbi:RNA-directed DNA polymerase [Mitsuaria sp. TWR114]|uniref:RNA-directed DNA polymerase n=1 Tax=Mitsuaria sp. TWR114 TaxID=2601731 RepID=UPI0011BE6E78|nr:RNA-directed DNA polymerase [Mitsuaria sp. TWR114]TXD99424.1 RNA-directed DNA polymerase [Mitsuaria sp. TWR114]
MSLIQEKYRFLAPRLEYLSDPVVLSLAWKKASAYVRRHNWYADTLELDSSGLNLEGLTQTWSVELASGAFEPGLARLVLAPKNGRWGFHPDFPGGWGPVPTGESKPGTEQVPLRPLAHLGVREQTAAAGVMLCLADCIESAQGNPAVASVEAQAKGVFSYGNRLYCQWSPDDKIARFAWGSADTYSRYYQDYQRFVARPREVASALEAEASSRGQRIFVIKLDLSSFFDGIDIERLVDKMRAEYIRFKKALPSQLSDDKGFWEAVARVLRLQWAPADEELAPLLKGESLPRGLPQGLMASGFLANAYLLEFDRAMGTACTERHQVDLGGVQVVVHDYCRYVDDLRLVVAADADLAPSQFETAVVSWVQAELDRSIGAGDGQGGLRINDKKTESELLTHVAGATSVASRMRQVQQQLSGPFDLSSLEELETALNGLLSMAEAESADARKRPAGDLPPLAVVSRPPMDVRDDTLTRFAAFRLCKSLRHRRLLADLNEKHDGRTAGELLLQDFELTARRLVGSWAENPSLVQVLRYAFDLFPSPELLHDVLDALNRKLQDAEQFPDQASVAWYVLAELFRSAATETGKRWANDEGFAAGDLEAYRGNLAAYAEGLLQVGGSPWYVRQQAALLLATLNSPTLLVGDEVELGRYRALHDYLAGRVTVEALSEQDVLGSAVIGYQVTGDDKHFKAWLAKFSARFGRSGAARALELIYKGSAALFDTITVPGAGTGARTKGLLGRELAMHVDSRWSRPAGPLPPAWIPLSRAITHPTHPFRHENALLRLAVAVAGHSAWGEQGEHMYTVFDLDVKCSNWQELDDPDGSPLQVRLAPSFAARQGPRQKSPAWCRHERAWQYALGAILRAAAVGSNDYTLGWRVGVGELGWYRGLPSTSARRRLGMLHTSQALGGSVSSVTPWFTDLLSALLRWPGIEGWVDAHEADRTDTPPELQVVLEGRLAFQRVLYGRSSGSPVYRYPVSWQARDARTLRIAVVQGLLPAVADFTDGLSALDKSSYRTRHRNHTASLLRLAAKKLGAYESLHGKPRKPVVDLVVLPEYAVHVDDQDLLRAFSDETGAMLHYGLLGARHPDKGDHTNAARWLIPARTPRRRAWIEVDQGKLHLTEEEVQLGVTQWCPYRVVVELQLDGNTAYRMVGAICYDATDLALAADLKNESHLFLVPALNKDIKTFDGMAAALRYHMYQHVVICNTGEFGGSTAQAPYDEEHRRTISHAHGAGQIAVAVFEVQLDDFGPELKAVKQETTKSVKKRLGKTPPAGLNRRI